MNGEKEESSNAALKAFGAIPNAYFDLIARVMPGFLLLFGINLVSSKNVVSAISNVFIPTELHDSTAAWIIVVLSTTYILGHALSPLVRYLEEGPGWAETVRKNRKESKRWLRYCLLPPFWSCPEASSEGRDVIQKQYNTLRFKNPALAALAIRIRAEYTMYGGFAVAITITLFLVFIYMLDALIHHNLAARIQSVTLENWLLLIVGILAVPVMLYRHLHTWNRFVKTVDHLLNPSKSNINDSAPLASK